MPLPTEPSLRNPTPLIEDNFTAAVRLYSELLSAPAGAGKIPRTFENGKLVFVDYKDWTSGFFPGALWLIYEHTREPRWKKAALDYTNRVAPAAKLTDTHDLGFMLYCSHGHALRFTRNRAHRDILLEGAKNLANRFNPAARTIRSWDHYADRWRHPVIIDNLMNLEFLLWAARETNEPRYREIAIGHAHQTLANHFRQDGSCYHVVGYDPESGAPVIKETFQGYANESSWARGQGWALYGYTMLYRETRNPLYLKQAHASARFIRTHPRLPSDKIPLWDFDAPAAPEPPRDASAAAVIASGLIELADYSEPDTAQRYRELAWRQLVSLSSPGYRAKPGENGGFILKHSTGNFNKNSEVDTPLNYADYYFLEALLRLKVRAQNAKPSPAG
jgi:rhamnogalacturonyl hydrolase YesR